MSQIYENQRAVLLELNPSFAPLLPENAPSKAKAMTIGNIAARQLLAEPANNYASLQIVVGWGDGSILKHIGKDPILRQKQTVIFLLEGEESDFAASFHEDLLSVLANELTKMFHITSEEEIAYTASSEFAHHEDIPRLSGCDIIDSHPLNPKAEAKRKALLPSIYRHLGDRPQSYGNDITDSFTGLHNASYNAKTLLPAPTLGEIAGFFGDAPVISIGGGPSLGSHIDTLRSLQNKCVLIAADSTCPGLIKEGIEPHFVTPIERLPATVELVQCLRGTRTWFTGSYVIPKEAVEVFKERCIGIYAGDRLYDWLLPDPGLRVNTGSSTGVFSCSVGTQLSNGPVYLVGHDLCKANDASHWSGSDYSAKLWSESKTSTNTTDVLNGYEDRLVPGNNGDHVLSITWWDRFRQELAMHATMMSRGKRKLYNVNAHHGVGALIPGTFAAPLPQPSDLDDLPTFTPPKIQTERLKQWQDRAKKLPEDAKNFNKHLGDLRKDIHVMKKLAPKDWQASQLAQRLTTTSSVSEGNSLAFAYFLRSALHNHTAEMHYRRRTANSARNNWVILDSMDSLCQALYNAVDSLTPTLERIVDDCC